MARFLISSGRNLSSVVINGVSFYYVFGTLNRVIILPKDMKLQRLV